MLTRREKWVLGIAISFAVVVIALFVSALLMARRFEPYIRDQAILYLRQRFDSEVELAGLRVRLPKLAPLQLIRNHGHGAVARVEGDGLSLRHRGRRDIPPMFVIQKFHFEVELGALFDTPKLVREVVIDGMEINIPPKGQRPAGDMSSSGRPGVIIEEVFITNSALSVLSKEEAPAPLRHPSNCVAVGRDGCRDAIRGRPHEREASR